MELGSRWIQNSQDFITVVHEMSRVPILLETERMFAVAQHLHTAQEGLENTLRQCYGKPAGGDILKLAQARVDELNYELGSEFMLNIGTGACVLDCHLANLSCLILDSLNLRDARYTEFNNLVRLIRGWLLLKERLELLEKLQAYDGSISLLPGAPREHIYTPMCLYADAVLSYISGSDSRKTMVIKFPDLRAKLMYQILNGSVDLNYPIVLGNISLWGYPVTRDMLFEALLSLSKKEYIRLDGSKGTDITNKFFTESETRKNTIVRANHVYGGLRTDLSKMAVEMLWRYVYNLVLEFYTLFNLREDRDSRAKLLGEGYIVLELNNVSVDAVLQVLRGTPFRFEYLFI